MVQGSPLALVVCGAPLAARTHDIARAAADEGWGVSVTATAAALPWLDEAKIQKVVGRPHRTDFRSPDHPEPRRPPAVIACPITFNTLNKLVAGVADNYATSLLCESLGAGVPIVAVPMVNQRLWGHPAWSSNLTRLREAGVTLLDVHTGGREPRAVPSGAGKLVVEAFDPAWVMDALRREATPVADVVDEAWTYE